MFDVTSCLSVTSFLLLYKFSRIGQEELEAMFGLDDLRKTRYFQDVELEASRKSLRQSIMDILSVRFLSIPSNIEENLNTIKGISVLRGLLVQSATVKKMAEFR